VKIFNKKYEDYEIEFLRDDSSKKFWLCYNNPYLQETFLYMFHYSTCILLCKVADYDYMGYTIMALPENECLIFVVV
jgi:hypothetical protein